MRRGKCLTILTTGALVFASFTAQAETLQEAVQHMLVSNPEIKSAYYNRQAKEQEVGQAKAGYFPRLDYSVGIGVYDTYEPDEAESSSTPKEHKLSLRQNVFNGFATVNEVKRQEARVGSASFSLRYAAESTALKAANVYVNVLRHLELNELAKENLLIHQRIFDQMKLRSDSGVDYKANLDHVQGRLALAQSNQVVTEINVIDAQTHYEAVVGRFPENLIKPQPLDAQLPPTMEDAQHLAVDNHPVLKSAEEDLVARKAQDEVAKSAFLPIVDIEVDRAWKDDVSPYTGWREDLTAMVRLRLNLFKGWSDKARKQETFELINEAREIQNTTHRQVIESIRLSWMANKAVQDKIKHLNAYVQSASATAEAFTKQWSIGKRTMLDVLDTEAEVINAKKDLINTMYDGLYAQCRILNGMGGLVHALGLRLPGEEDAAVKGEEPKTSSQDGSVANDKKS